MYSVLLLALSLIVAVAPAASSQQQAPASQPRPDFTGTWKLNLDRSDYGDLQGPETRTDVIEVHGDRITEHVSAEGRHRPQQYTMSFATDGTPGMLSPGARMGMITILGISAIWDKSSLILTQSLQVQGAPLSVINRYTLSADAKTLTINVALRGEADIVAMFVFDRM